MDSYMRQAFTDLLARLQNNPNALSPSAYDTAWLAWLYPAAREWLINAQHPDGSWGAELEYYHDRVIATLSAINAIAATSANASDLKRVERGIRYLEGAIPRLAEDVYETIGFELLLPSLVEIGRSLGLKLDRIQTLIEPQMPIYHQKLALIPKEMIYSTQSAVAHSLEFIGFDKLDKAAVAGIRAADGSIHSSPAATAFVEIGLNGSPAGAAYLDQLIQQHQGVSPSFAPSELFEIIWALHHLSLSADLRSLSPEIDPLIEIIAAAWKPIGIGFSPSFVPDLDDTALGFKILNDLEIFQDPLFFENYEVGDHFQCLPLERNLSLDVHIHVIHALKDTPDFPRRDDMLLKALNILGRDLTTEFIVDKWHVSPYYSTSHAIIALTGLSDNIIKKQINWLLKTQRHDGSWTYYPDCPLAAIEETAYALLALMKVYEIRGNIPFDIINKGFDYLEKHHQPAKALPALWIHKNLYNAHHIVDSVILAAMAQYQELAGKSVVHLAY